MKILYLALGGLAGTLARYWMNQRIQQILGAVFPYGILAVNVAGCFLLGLFFILAENKFPSGAEARLFLMVGFCGAFTTFSTWIFDTSELLKTDAGLAAVNLFASVILGFFALKAGMVIGRIF